MAIITGAGGGGGTKVDFDSYLFRISKVEFVPNVTNRFYDPTKPQEGSNVPTQNEVHLTFQIVADLTGDDTWEGEELTSRVTAKNGPGATLLTIARAAFKDPSMAPFTPIDTDELVDKLIVADVVQGGERGLNEDGTKDYWRNITGYRPAKSKKAKKPIEPATDADFEDEDAA